MNNIYQDLCEEMKIWPIYEAGLIWEGTITPLNQLVKERRARIGRAAAELVQSIEPGGGDIVSVTLEVDKILVERVVRPMDVVDGEIATKVHEERVVVYGELRKLEKENA